MPSHSTESSSSESGEKKTRGAPKAHPPKSIIQRIAREKAGKKHFQAAAYKLIQTLSVEYARSIFAQCETVLSNRKGKTLTTRDLRVLASIGLTASSGPVKEDLSAVVQKFVTDTKTNAAYIKKKNDRAKKREEKKAQKVTETATTTTTSSETLSSSSEEL